jgi:hypothetical protein
MIIYFAHSMRDYGTRAAREAKAEIQRLRPDATISDPEEMDWNGMMKRLGSHDAVYRKVVQEADEVVVLEHMQHVGKGAYTEITMAIQLGKPCYALRRGALVPIVGARTVDPNDWKIFYGRVRTTKAERVPHKEAP